MAPALGCESAGRAGGIAVAGSDEDLPAGLFVHRVVSGQADQALRNPMVEDQSGQDLCQPPGPPTPLGEDRMLAGRMARGQDPIGPQQVEDRPPSGREDCRAERDEPTLEGRARECTCKLLEQWLGGRGNRHYVGLLVLDFGHSGIDPLQVRQGRGGTVRKFGEVWWRGRHHEMTQPPIPLP